MPGQDRPQHPVCQRDTGVLCCNRFDGALLEPIPLVLTGKGGLHWAGLDLTLIGLLTSRGAQPHLHEPPLRHLAFGANPPPWAEAMTEDDWSRVDP